MCSPNAVLSFCREEPVGNSLVWGYCLHLTTPNPFTLTSCISPASYHLQSLLPTRLIFVWPLGWETHLDSPILNWGFPGGSVVKNLPAMQELQEPRVRSLDWEDPLDRKKWQPTLVFLPGKSH